MRSVPYKRQTGRTRLESRLRPVQSSVVKTLAREQQCALDLLDRLGHLDATRAGIGAVERRAAAPHTLDVVEDVETLGGCLVTAGLRDLAHSCVLPVQR